ncbi:Panacea domain-containing protein [Lactobacillus delbrueckii]|uniref:Panacea domain-containing protein n=2 Tax=Lactobacillus delbrueckii TaxID=1584 RepID=UPI0037C76E1A
MALDENVEPLTQMKLIKLLYFAYGRYLVKTNNKLFTSSIVHSQYDPVITEVHSKFKGLTVLDTGKPSLDTGKPSKEAFDDYNLVSKDGDISHLLRLVNEAYINYSASGLSQKTHQPGSPWSLTDDGKIIKDQLIFDTFSNGLEE